MSACQRAFTRIRSRHGFAAPPRPLGAPESTVPVAKPRKRPSAGDLSTPSHVAPGFSSFPSVNNPSPAHGLPSVIHSPGGRSQKKRGRPSKAEHELRAAEAAARGEPYPPPKKTRIPKVPADQGSSMTGEGGNFGASVPFESQRGTPKAILPHESQIALEAAAGAASDMGQPQQAPAMESQSEALSPSENLVAGLQEHAVRASTSPTEAKPTEEQLTPQVPTSTSTAQVEPFPRTQNEPYQTPYQ